MSYPTRDELLAEATRCIDRAFAEGKHGVVIVSQIRDASQVDFVAAVWEGAWNPTRAVMTYSSLLLPVLRMVYAQVPASPLREADRIICDFAAAVRESERREAEAN